MTDSQDMVIIHRVFRRELSMAPAPEWASFMSHLPVPVQEAFAESGEQSYRKYIRAVRRA